LPFRQVTLVPLAGVAVDVLRAEARTARAVARSFSVEPAAELGTAVRYDPARTVWLRGTLLGGLTPRPHDFVVDAGGGPAYRTAVAFVRVTLEAGLVLGKK
jgi:hypothetical protein